MSDDYGAARKVPVKVEGIVEVKVEVKRELEDDRLEGREGEGGGKRRKVGGGMKGIEIDAFAPMVEEEVAVAAVAVEENGVIDIPFGDPCRLVNGFLIPASRSITLMPRIHGNQPIFCSCEALGVGPMNKYDCFNYIKANQPDEFYTVPILHGDPRRNVAYGNNICRVSIPSSWMVTMAPTTGSHDDPPFASMKH